MTADLEALAVELARGAGAVLRDSFARGASVQHKGRIDLVTDADRASERHILAGIRARYPGHSVLAEESGDDERGGEFRWVVDPLDGTVNFAHGLPHFCVLIAAQRRTDAGFVTEVGVTYDPLRDELFVARAGGGATLNGTRVHVSRTTQLIEATGATGFAYDRLTAARDNYREFLLMSSVTRGLRRFGAAGLDLAYVACGRFDFYWEYALKPWDVTPGALLVREAGGVVSELVDDPARGTAVAVSNGALHDAFLAALTHASRSPLGDRAAVAAHLPADLAASPRS